MAFKPTPEQPKALQRISVATGTANALKRAGRDHEARLALTDAANRTSDRRRLRRLRRLSLETVAAFAVLALFHRMRH